MLRKDLISAVSNISFALKDSQVYKILTGPNMPALSTDGTNNYSNVLFDAFATLSTIYNKEFGVNEKIVIDQLKIKSIFEASWWSSVQLMLTSERKATVARAINRESSRIKFCEENLPSIIELLSRDYDVDAPFKELGSSLEPNHIEILSLVLSEDKGTVSSARRVSDAIESIILLYSAFALLHSVPDNGLSIISCDSGSDKQFDFTGLGDVMKEVKEFILSAWSQVVFHKEKKFKERIDAISSSLPILEKLSQMEQDGKIGRENCEIIRRNVVSGIEKFLNAGCTTPEMDNNSQFIPRMILKAGNTLLLEAPKEKSKGDLLNQKLANQDESEGESSSNEANYSDLDQMSPEQMKRELQRLRGTSGES